MARYHYDMQLKELKNQMMLLGAMIETAIQGAISAFTSQNAEKAKEIAAGDDKIDSLVRMIEQMCYNLLLRQQPIARDLRDVSAVLKMLTDMERIGDHAEDISELTILMAGSPYSKEEKLVEEMAKEVTVMLIDAIDAYVEGNIGKAKKVMSQDDQVDALFSQVKASIEGLLKEGNADGSQALDIFLVAKYFERIGDHATNIAEWVQFSLTGELPGESPA